MPYTVSATSLVKVRDQFVPYADIREVRHKTELEGAIVLKINRTDLITTQEWDDIEILWWYILNGLPQIQRGEAFETGFPDCAIDLSFTPTPRDRKVKVSVRIGKERRTASAPIDDVVKVLANEAYNFAMHFQTVFSPVSNQRANGFIAMAARAKSLLLDQPHRAPPDRAGNHES